MKNEMSKYSTKQRREMRDVKRARRAAKDNQKEENRAAAHFNKVTQCNVSIRFRSDEKIAAKKAWVARVKAIAEKKAMTPEKLEAKLKVMG